MLMVILVCKVYKYSAGVEMQFYYYAALFGVGAVSVFASQKYSRSTKTYYDILIYTLLTGVMACGVFAVSAGFKFTLDARIFMYAAVYAIAAFIANSASIPIYRYMGIAEANVCRSSISLAVISVSGYIIFSEKVTVVSVIRILLMILATLAVYFGHKDIQNEKNKDKKAMGIGIFICVVVSFSGLLATVTSKAFAADERVSDTNSLFFFTNVIMIVISLIFVLAFKTAGKANAASDKLKLWQYGMIFLTTLASNIASLLQVLILETGNVSMYAPLSGALNLLAAQTVSVLYREKIKPLPLLLAISAVILGIFE